MDFKPYSSIIKKQIPGQKDVRVVVRDVTGKKLWPQVAIVKLGRKKDAVVRSYINFHDTLTFPKYKANKKIFWTVEALYPLFFVELHFNFKEEYNYYEINLNLPEMCLPVTEGKGWVQGKSVMTILDFRHIDPEYKQTHEFCWYEKLEDAFRLMYLLL